MNSQNVAIIALFVLVIIIVYQLYFKGRNILPQSRNPMSETDHNYVTFDELDGVIPKKIYHPKTLSALQKIVQENIGKDIRSVGDGYCFNQLFFTDSILIYTDKLRKIIDIDPEEKTVDIEAGVRIKDLLEKLAEKGLTLPSIPECIDRSIADAISTSAHGSNSKVGTLSDQLIDITVILPTGEIRRSEQKDPEFPAFATNLGCLGIVYSVTLKCVDDFTIQEQSVHKNWDQIKSGLLDVLDTDPLLELHITPSSRQVEMYRSRTRVPFQKRHTKCEVAIPYESVVPAVDAVLELYTHQQPVLKYGLIVRFTAADHNSWLSPASGRASAWLQVGTECPIDDKPHLYKFFRDFEKLLINKYQGRPDWTTCRSLKSGTVKRLYGLSARYFKRIRDRFDPHQVFSNNFITEYI